MLNNVKGNLLTEPKPFPMPAPNYFGRTLRKNTTENKTENRTLLVEVMPQDEENLLTEKEEVS